MGVCGGGVGLTVGGRPGFPLPVVVPPHLLRQARLPPPGQSTLATETAAIHRPAWPSRRVGWPGLGGGAASTSRATLTRSGSRPTSRFVPSVKMIGRSFAAQGLLRCTHRILALQRLCPAATASAASGMPGKVWSPEHTIAGTVTGPSGAASRGRR